MNAVDVHLQHFDDTWNHQWESLADVLVGVTDEEAGWQAPAYAVEEEESGWPLPGTIRWHIAHVAHCKRYYTKLLACRGQTERPAAEPREAPADVAGELAALREAHARQREAIAGLDASHLGDPLPNEMSVTEFLAMATRHDAWHAGQIAVARRLFRTRPDA